MFDMLGIDSALRDGIRMDLLRFVQQKEHYVHRSYLEARVPTPRPIDTGKTGLITPITNLLEFNIYDLEITTVQSNTEEWSSASLSRWRLRLGAISSTSDSGEGSTQSGAE